MEIITCNICGEKLHRSQARRHAEVCTLRARVAELEELVRHVLVTEQRIESGELEATREDYEAWKAKAMQVLALEGGES